MTRFADALRRARLGPTAGSGADDDRPGDAIRFFAPGQPAIVSPWEIGNDHPPAPAPEPPARAMSERRPAVAFQEREVHTETRVRFPPLHRSDKLIVSDSIEPIVREQYNKLAAALHHLQLERTIKVVTITSAVPHEGKTLTAANLALTLSESYQRRVLLIDADLRHPTTHVVFGIANTRGLSDSAPGQGPVPFMAVTPRLSLVMAGSPNADPVKTLTSDYMRDLVEHARTEYDWVLFDTAPIGLLTDAGLLASMADGALLVARAGQTPWDVIQRAAEAVGIDRILGVVLNGVAEQELPAGYGDGYYGPRKGN